MGLSGAVLDRARARRLGAVGTAIWLSSSLNAVPDYAASTVRAGGGEGVYGALEAVEESPSDWPGILTSKALS